MITAFNTSLWADQKVFFDIPEGPATTTLSQFEKQAAVKIDNQLGYASLQTHAVRGQFEPVGALSSMLCGTGAALEGSESGTFIVKTKRTSIHVDGGDATLTLNEFSRQTGLQLLFDYNVLRGLRTHSVAGELDPCGALTAMVNGTNLVFDFVNPRTLAVTLASKATQIVSGSDTKPQRGRRRGSRRDVPESAPDSLEEIYVTAGREQTRALAGAEMERVSRVDIDRSGAGTVAQLVQTLPENFGGGPTEDTVLGREAASNSGLGIGMNLRGLGASATLSLVNGRPIAPSGTSASFADVSNVPLVALDHIDIIPAGSSVRYGSQAYGGIVNFVLRQGYDGAESQVRVGTATAGGLTEKQLSQLWGRSDADGDVMVALEYDHRNPLDASGRRQATSDLSPFGGTNFDSPMGNPGTLSIGSQTWAIPSGQDGTHLKVSQLVAGTANLHDIRQGTTVLPEQERWSIYATGERKLGSSLNVFADLLFSDRQVHQRAPAVTSVLSVPSTNPFYVNPAGGSQPVHVLYGFLDDLGPQTLEGGVRTGSFTIGFKGWRAGGWTLSGGLGLSFEKQHNELGGRVDSSALNQALADPNPQTAFNPFGDGSHTSATTLAAIRSTATYRISSTYWLANLGADRELARLPAGGLLLSAGLDARRQALKTDAMSPELNAASNQGRRTEGAFAELQVPLFGSPEPFAAGARRLVLSIAGRYDRHSDVGSSFSPTIGAVWQMAPILTLRGSWARLYRPPTLGDLSEVDAGSELLSVPDSSSASGLSQALVRFGGNRGLRPESAISRALGLDIGSRSITGWMLSLTYFDIEVHNQVDSLPVTTDFFGNAAFSAFVNRSPTPTQRAAICSNGTFIGDLTSCLTAPIAGVIDLRLNNIARTRTRGIDVASKYTLATKVGDFDFGLNGTYILEFARAQTPDGVLIQLRNTQNNPLAAHVRGSVGWQSHGWGVFSFVNFSSSYRDSLTQPARGVSSWTTLDLQLRYDFSSDSPPLRGTSLILEAQNLLGRYPPFLNNPLGIGYDQENGDLSGRVVSLALRKKW
ncbi:MAG: TonB-dependent receptor [Proteobacteria bacterium]|nr:TonB-dependent receptor [Pseudomonadota bacterium]